jgi:hypothetical protein
MTVDTGDLCQPKDVVGKVGIIWMSVDFDRIGKTIE